MGGFINDVILGKMPKNSGESQKVYAIDGSMSSRLDLLMIS